MKTHRTAAIRKLLAPLLFAIPFVTSAPVSSSQKPDAFEKELLDLKAITQFHLKNENKRK